MNFRWNEKPIIRRGKRMAHQAQELEPKNYYEKQLSQLEPLDIYGVKVKLFTTCGETHYMPLTVDLVKYLYNLAERSEGAYKDLVGI